MFRLTGSRFHFDEENGERPCEAAYLSELKAGAGRGVNEVVMLVSCVCNCFGIDPALTFPLVPATSKRDVMSTLD
jgi:hypothetical protein